MEDIRVTSREGEVERVRSTCDVRHEKTDRKVFVVVIIEMSVSYQKKDGCSHVRTSFFWYDNDARHIVWFCHDLASL